MRALTLTQPWATLVALGAKRIETRSWATPYRGPLAIHAAKGFGGVGGKRAVENLCHQRPFRDALMDAGVRSGEARIFSFDMLPLGSIVAVADLVDVLPTDTDPRILEGHAAPDEFAFGDYSLGRYAWLLARAVALEHPLKAQGALGLWTPEPHVAAYCQGILDSA